MAVMCRHNSSTVDAYIPVVMDKSARLDPSVMSVLLVQFKPRAQAGTMAINGFFSKPTGAGETQPRPYVTLIMDLDVTEKDPLLEKTPTRTTQHVEASARQRATENVHPRYSVYVHGCSPTAYRVIGAGERSIYQNILRRGQLIGEHPRQDATSLRQVRMQKPFFAAGPMSWHWLHNAWLNRGENDAHKKGPDPEGGVVFEDGHSLSNHSNE
ncbi:hypothetical protein C8Q76DRAFT_613947 [Earliella scabrosa]|nr:hypothetical protein C8Q76DRAFT_613947 [Earliella scabrosa]